MHTIRKTSGLAGFPKRDESIYDAFGAGHSSTSISAGLGVFGSHHFSPLLCIYEIHRRRFLSLIIIFPRQAWRLEGIF
jgi:hypothetical protein